MDIQSFDKRYDGIKQAEKISIDCDHPDHDGPRQRILGKGPARRNILKNGGEKFVCRDCTMAYDNPMTKVGQGRNSLGDIKVLCPECGVTRTMASGCYYGSLEEPYMQLCGTCAQTGKVIPEDQKAKISDTLSGRTLTEEHKTRISEYMKTNKEGIDRGKANLIPGYSGGWNTGLSTPPEVRAKQSAANLGKVRTEEHKLNISEGRKAMLQSTGGFSQETREKLRQATLRQYERGFNPNTHHKSGRHASPKAGSVFHRSSYEKQVFMWLDDLVDVKTYEVEAIRIPFWNPLKKSICTFVVDMLVHFHDGSKLAIEVKPTKWLTSLVNEAKVEALAEWSKTNSIPYEVWDEYTLYGHTDTQKKAKAFADWLSDYLTAAETERDIDEVSAEALEARRFESRVKARRFYHAKLKDQITVSCEFCKTEHTIRQVQYDQNVEKNGRFICIKENGYLTGKKPKDYLKKENPYAAEGRKKCLGECGRVLDLNLFGDDKSRADGKASRCKECRAKASIQKYHSQ